MNNNERTFCNDFEMEVFLYLDNELLPERKEFWEMHLKDCNKCRQTLSSVISIFNQVREESKDDLLDAKFDKIVEQAVSTKKFSLNEWFFPHGTIREKYSFSLKIAVVGIITVVTLVISLTSQKPNTVKNISSDLLDWEGKKITTQINDLKNTLNIMQEDNWDKQMIQLDQRIKKLEKETDKFSFN